jgi:hypothetical protein
MGFEWLADPDFRPEHRRKQQLDTDMIEKASISAPEVAGLSPEEWDKVREAARAKVAKEIHDKLFADALEEAEREERIARGLTPKTGPTKQDEPRYTITLNLPESVAPVPALSIDGRLWWDQQTYQNVPESVAMCIHEMQARAWENDDRMSRGREKDRKRPKPQIINGKTGAVTGASLAMTLAA